MERSQIEHDLTNAAVTNEPERIKKLIHIFDDPHEAVRDAHAIVVLTEWDEFKVSGIFEEKPHPSSYMIKEGRGILEKYWKILLMNSSPLGIENIGIAHNFISGNVQLLTLIH